MRITYVCIFVLFITNHLRAQEAILAGGGNSSGGEGSICYSIGQLAYKVQATSEISITEGIQQPYEISVLSSSKNPKETNLNYSFFPNPVSNNLILTIHSSELINLRIELFDLKGRLLQESTVKSNTTHITMAEYVSGTYLLKVYKNNKKMNVYKIIKK